MADAARGGIEYEKLGQYLKALSNPSRLELLDHLRFPKAAAELRLNPRRPDALPSDRAMSRQAVEEHLQVLEAIGVVARRDAAREGRTVEEYVLNQQRVFAIIEELRKLTGLRATALADAGATMDAEARTGAAWTPGPKLVLVSGPWEGKVFPLAPGAGPWLIGRRRGVAVALDYDGFASQENAEVRASPSGWVLRDLPRSKNGTSRNFVPLPKQGEAPLASGDVVGVGRSLLVFREG